MAIRLVTEADLSAIQALDVQVYGDLYSSNMTDVRARYAAFSHSHFLFERHDELQGYICGFPFDQDGYYATITETDSEFPASDIVDGAQDFYLISLVVKDGANLHITHRLLRKFLQSVAHYMEQHHLQQINIHTFPINEKIKQLCLKIGFDTSPTNNIMLMKTYTPADIYQYARLIIQPQ